MHLTSFANAAGLVLLAATLYASPSYATAEGPVEFTIQLEDALMRYGVPYDLEIFPYLACKGGFDELLDGRIVDSDQAVWEENFLGYAGVFHPYSIIDQGNLAGRIYKKYNFMDHNGTITGSSIDHDGTMRLSIDMSINPDPYIPGGTAHYELEFTLDHKGISGAYAGTFVSQADGNTYAVSGSLSGFVRTKAWPRSLDEFAPLGLNEHPRLVFRAADLPALKERAQTAIGRKLIAHMIVRLDNDTFSIWDAAGYGFLYQITGEAHYAEKSRTMMDRILANEKDGFDTQGSYYYLTTAKLRLGPVLSAMALAYDFCYSAWDPDYRVQIARAIQVRLPFLAFDKNHGQAHFASNHYGAWNGGAGIAALGILGDPGVDNEMIAAYSKLFERRIKRVLESAFGTGGWFQEGHHPGRISSNMGVVPYIQALRVAAGKDLVKDCPSANSFMRLWCMELVRIDGAPQFPRRGGYGTDTLDNETTVPTHGGEFYQDFGIVDPSFRRAGLWVYNTVVDPDEATRFERIRYPHRAMYALVNWPMGEGTLNPSKVLPHVWEDAQKGYYVCRNKWQDSTDAVVTALLGTEPMTELGKLWAGPVRIFALGLKYNFPGGFARERLSYLQKWEDGSMVLSARPRYSTTPALTSLAVDFSGASGAPVMVAMAGSNTGVTFKDDGKIQPTVIADQKGPDGATTNTTMVTTAAGTKFAVVTIQSGPAPTVIVNGETVVVGNQAVRFDGEKLVLSVEPARKVSP